MNTASVLSIRAISGRAWMHLPSRAQGRSLGLVDLKGKEKLEIIECMALKP